MEDSRPVTPILGLKFAVYRPQNEGAEQTRYGLFVNGAQQPLSH
jgi:hypothetical protein